MWVCFPEIHNYRRARDYGNGTAGHSDWVNDHAGITHRHLVHSVASGDFVSMAAPRMYRYTDPEGPEPPLTVCSLFQARKRSGKCQQGERNLRPLVQPLTEPQPDHNLAIATAMRTPLMTLCKALVVMVAGSRICRSPLVPRLSLIAERQAIDWR